VEVCVTCLLEDDAAAILSDVYMPSMWMDETAEPRANVRATSPIIFVTADAWESHTLSRLLPGAVDYFLKPVDPGDT